MANRLIGQVKWFDNGKNFGFIIVRTEGEHLDKNIFVHQLNIRANGYRKLHKGEYIEFSYTENTNEATKERHPYQATDVSGILNGPLMCDFENENSNENSNEGFRKVQPKKRRPNNKKVYGTGYSRMNEGGSSGGQEAV
jgi:cold shock CspA family protein